MEGQKQVFTKEDFYKKIAEKSQCLLMSVSDQLVKKCVLSAKQDVEKNIIILDKSHATIVNEMVVQKGVREFLELSTAQISLLTPRIRFYKSWMNKPDKEDTEFLFSSYFMGEKLFNENGYEYLGNVGIKSFELINQGTDFATNYLYKCKLELFFGNIEELTANHYTDSGERISFLDLLFPPTYQSADDFFRLKAVVGFARSGGAIDHNNASTSFDFMPEEIHSQIDSWNLILFLERVTYNFQLKEDGTITITIEFVSSVDKTLESDESDILSNPEIRNYISIVNDLKKKVDDQKAKLETEVLPGLAGKLADKDFNPYAQVEIVVIDEDGNVTTKKVDSSILIQDAMIMTQKQKDSYLSEAGVEGQFVALDETNPVFKESATDLSNYSLLTESLKKSQEFLNSRLDERYQKILYKLINSSRTFYFDINIEDLMGSIGLTMGITGGDYIFYEEDINKVLKEFNSKFANISVKNYDDQEINNYTTANIRNEELHDATVEIIENTFDNLMFFTQEAALEEANADLISAREDLLAQNIASKGNLVLGLRVNFMFLGDLINEVFQILRENGAPLKHYAIMLGDITFSSDGKVFHMNIADLPVSREVFMDWFNKEIFDAKKERLTVRSFLVSMMRQIIPAMINSGCFGGNSRTSEEIEIRSFTLPKERYEALLKPPYNRNKYYTLFEGSQATTFRTPEKYMDIIYIKSQNFITADLTGEDIEKDFSKGIYHLYMGSSHGIIKKVEFDKVDDANIIASNVAKAVKSDSFGEDTITTFYDVNLELVGNTLFVPGMLFYLNPTFAGLGNPKARNSIARNIGIGGYYDILKVDHYFSPGNFTTKIRGKWKGYTGKKVEQNTNIQLGKEKYEDALKKSDDNLTNLKEIGKANQQNKSDSGMTKKEKETDTAYKAQERYGQGL